MCAFFRAFYSFALCFAEGDIASFKKILKTVDKSAAAVVLSMYKYTCGFAAYSTRGEFSAEACCEKFIFRSN